MVIGRTLKGKWEAVARVQDFVGDGQPPCEATDYVPVVLVIGGLAEEGGWRHVLV